jgi:hypothetical protein
MFAFFTLKLIHSATFDLIKFIFILGGETGSWFTASGGSEEDDEEDAIIGLTIKNIS